MSQTNFAIALTHHLRQRMRERVPEISDIGLRRLVTDEIIEGIRDGRIAKNRPRWAASNGHRGLRDDAHPTARFVWNEENTRCYAIRKAAGRVSRETWLVLTVITPTKSDEQRFVLDRRMDSHKAKRKDTYYVRGKRRTKRRLISDD